jgi:hypothetical protein
MVAAGLAGLGLVTVAYEDCAKPEVGHEGGGEWGRGFGVGFRDGDGGEGECESDATDIGLEAALRYCG